MLPPHKPQNIKAKGPDDVFKRMRVGSLDAKPLARMAFGNIRLRLKRPPAALKPSLRILDGVRR